MNQTPEQRAILKKRAIEAAEGFFVRTIFNKDSVPFILGFIQLLSDHEPTREQLIFIRGEVDQILDQSIKAMEEAGV